MAWENSRSAPTQQAPISDETLRKIERVRRQARVILPIGIQRLKSIFDNPKSTPMEVIAAVNILYKIAVPQVHELRVQFARSRKRLPPEIPTKDLQAAMRLIRGGMAAEPAAEATVEVPAAPATEEPKP